jgi:hypothetical protein
MASDESKEESFMAQKKGTTSLKPRRTSGVGRDPQDYVERALRN